LRGGNAANRETLTADGKVRVVTANLENSGTKEGRPRLGRVVLRSRESGKEDCGDEYTELKWKEGHTGKGLKGTGAYRGYGKTYAE